MHSPFKGKFRLDYQIGINDYSYFNSGFKFIGVQNKEQDIKTTFLINGKELDRDVIEIPNSLIALSVMLTDKFPTEISGFPAYKYLGVKYSSNAARTTTFVKKTVELLFSSLGVGLMHENISKGLKFLGYENFLFISYTPRHKRTIFQDSLDIKTFENFFLRFWEYTNRKQESKPWSLAVFEKIKSNNPEKIPKLVDLCKKLKTLFQPIMLGSRSEYFGFNIFDPIFSNEELDLIANLYSLDLISYPTITFKKQTKEFDLEESSSGEYHFIAGFIGLLATLKSNSIVLIDEPENSLHPNWQMKYISFLKGILKDYSSCHFIIATHSHFMVSDLNGSSSNLNVLRKKDKIEAENIPSNTYGWSAEEVLLNVFQTPSTRNFYLSDQLGEIFQLVSEEPDKRNVAEIKRRIGELKKLDLSGLSKEDPLKDVINQLFTKFENA